MAVVIATGVQVMSKKNIKMNLKKILFKHKIEASLQVYVVSKKDLKVG